MAIDDSTNSGSGETATDSSGLTSGADCRVGSYSWADFMDEYGYSEEVDALYPADGTDTDQLGLDVDSGPAIPRGDDWDDVSFDPAAYLGFHPDDLRDIITDTAAPNAKMLHARYLKFLNPSSTPVVKDVYRWFHFEQEFGADAGRRLLGFDPDLIEAQLDRLGSKAVALDELIDERTVNVNQELDEDDFFSTADGHTTVTNRYDLEKAVTFEKKQYFREEERYWVNKPYSFVIIFHSQKENEKKYYVVEPYLTSIESELKEFLSGKLRTAIKYADDTVKLRRDEDGRREVIEKETRRLLKRYDLFDKQGKATESTGLLNSMRELLNEGYDEGVDKAKALQGLSVRPEPAVLAEDSDTLSEYQIEKILYLLKRNFIGYERIDGIKNDINVEDISCDGYNSPVFVYHSGYEQIISNIHHGETELDDFVVKLAQRSGKGISKRMPQVDATLPDGSRAQLTLGREVSDHGTNYTIRQFKDVPFTPIDLINWNTFSLDEMAFLWLAIENHKSLIFAGGTASGKTTSLNAVSLFIPSNTKIVSIEDTREVELPQRNWIASVTRPSFSDDAAGDVDEFDLLEAALRQRPDYIVMGEIRGEEGRTLFQVMSTGHTTYTTFHADSVDEVLKRFTTDPINVSKTMFTALDLVSIQTQTRVQGTKVRRNKSLTEINHYEAEHDEINVQDVYQWQAETDEYLKMGDSNTLEAIKFDRGWSHEKLNEELFKRRVILAYLIKNGLNTYAEVAATVQAFINDPETILTLVANEQLEDSLTDLRQMESVLINVEEKKEEQVPRPDATNETYNLSMDILERAEESLFEQYRGETPSGLGEVLSDVETADPITVGGDAPDLEFGGTLNEDESESWDFGSSGETIFDTSSEVDGTPSWLSEEGGFEVEASGAESDTQETETPTPTATPETGSETAGTDEPSPQALEEPEPEVEVSEIEEGEGDAPGTDGIDGLFDHMDRTLETVEKAELEQTESSERTTETNGSDSLFTEEKTIFGGGGETPTEVNKEPEPASEETDSIFGEDSPSVFSDEETEAHSASADEHESAPETDSDEEARTE